jgi:hypothetical protein
MGCETCGGGDSTAGGGGGDDTKKSPLPSVSFSAASQVAQDVTTVVREGDLSDGQVDGQGPSAVVNFAKKFQPAGPFQIAKGYADPQKDGSIETKTAFGTIGTLPPPPALGPTKRADPQPKPNLLPDYVIPGTPNGETA